MNTPSILIAAVAALFVAAAPAHARTSDKESARISSQFSGWAGGSANSDALVAGLRNGKQINLKTTVNGRTSISAFTPSTKPLGYGEVKTSLALAQKSLANQGIANPTAEQLQAAINGGTITRTDGTSVSVEGVTQLRASGQGWGQIAQRYDTKLGPVESGLESRSSVSARGGGPGGKGKGK